MTFESFYEFLGGGGQKLNQSIKQSINQSESVAKIATAITKSIC